MAAGTYAWTHHKSNQNIQWHCRPLSVASKHQNKSCQHWNLAFIFFKTIRNHNMWHFARFAHCCFNRMTGLPFANTHIKKNIQNGFYGHKKTNKTRHGMSLFKLFDLLIRLLLPFRLNPNEEHLKRNFRHSIGRKCSEHEWVTAQKWNETNIKFIMHGTICHTNEMPFA